MLVIVLKCVFPVSNLPLTARTPGPDIGFIHRFAAPAKGVGVRDVENPVRDASIWSRSSARRVEAAKKGTGFTPVTRLVGANRIDERIQLTL